MESSLTGFFLPISQGREKIVDFLTKKWQKEHGYKLKKTLWCFSGNRIAVRFQYEWHNDEGQWFRAEGNEVKCLLLSGKLQARGT